MEIDLVNIIGNLGFPIVMTLLYYFDFRKIIKKNTDKLNDLHTSIDNLKEAIEGM